MTIELPWTTLINKVGDIIGKVVPDKAAADSAKSQLLTLTAQGELQKDLMELSAITSAQTDINKVEAASPNWFIAGARPFVMWICAGGLMLNLIISPLFTWATALAGHPTPFPALDGNLLMGLLFPLLGLGAYRTVEKIQGVANVH